MIRKVLPDPEEAESKEVFYSSLIENTGWIVGAVHHDMYVVFLKQGSHYNGLNLNALSPSCGNIWHTKAANTLVQLCAWYEKSNWHVVACDTLAELLTLKPEDLE